MPSRTESQDRVLRAAEEQGADLAALRENLRLTPAERFAELVAMNAFHAGVQARTLPALLCGRLDVREEDVERDLRGIRALLESERDGGS